MKTGKALYKIKFIMMAGIMLAGLCTGMAACAQSDNLAVITGNKGAPADLKMAELKSIMMGEKQRWRNGNKIMIALMKTSTPTGSLICKKIYDMSSDEVRKFWLATVFEGKTEAPAIFNTTAELEGFIEDNPGAIGIINQAETTASMHVVSVDGKKTF